MGIDIQHKTDWEYVMTKSFLTSLIGLSVKEARNIVVNHGYEYFEIPFGGFFASIAIPKTVILEHDNDKVIRASAHDPLELV